MPAESQPLPRVVMRQLDADGVVALVRTWGKPYGAAKTSATASGSGLAVSSAYRKRNSKRRRRCLRAAAHARRRQDRIGVGRSKRIPHATQQDHFAPVSLRLAASRKSPVRFPMNGAVPQGLVFARIGAAPPGVQKDPTMRPPMFAPSTFRFSQRHASFGIGGLSTDFGGGLTFRSEATA